MSDLVQIKEQLPMVKVKNDLQLAFPHQMFGSKYKEWLSKFTQEEATQAAVQVNAMRGGNYSVLPRICPNLHRCPMSHSCPFKETDNVPVGLPLFYIPAKRQHSISLLKIQAERIHRESQRFTGNRFQRYR